MNLAYLIDTDWVIHWLNDHPAISQRLMELRGEGLAISVVSLAELYEGVYYSREPGRSERELLSVLNGLTTLGIDQETCQVFGRERGHLREVRSSVADFDLLIGATAIRYHLTLLTNNRRDFERIRGLRIESR